MTARKAQEEAQEEVWATIRKARPRTMALYVSAWPLLDPGFALVFWWFKGGGTRGFLYECALMLIPLTVFGYLLWCVAAPAKGRSDHH
jgi:hypothetical protein